MPGSWCSITLIYMASPPLLLYSSVCWVGYVQIYSYLKLTTYFSRIFSDYMVSPPLVFRIILFWCSWSGPRWIFSVLCFFFFTFPLKFWRLFSLFVCLPVFQFSIFNFQFFNFQSTYVFVFICTDYDFSLQYYIHTLFLLECFYIYFTSGLCFYYHWIFRTLFRREVFSIGRKSL